MEENINYNSDKKKLIGEEKWSEEIPAVVDGETTLVTGLNGIFQSLFNRVKAVNILPFFKWNFGFDINKLDKDRELNSERELTRDTLTNDVLAEIETNRRYARTFGKGLEDRNKEISVKQKDNSILVDNEGISVNRSNDYAGNSENILLTQAGAKGLYERTVNNQNSIDANSDEIEGLIYKYVESGGINPQATIPLKLNNATFYELFIWQGGSLGFAKYILFSTSHIARAEKLVAYNDIDIQVQVLPELDGKFEIKNDLNGSINYKLCVVA